MVCYWYWVLEQEVLDKYLFQPTDEQVHVWVDMTEIAQAICDGWDAEQTEDMLVT